MFYNRDTFDRSRREESTMTTEIYQALTTLESTAAETANRDSPCCSCHSIIDGDGFETADGTLFCDEACAEDAGYRYCPECEEWHDGDGIETDDGWYCSEDCARADGWELCEQCGEWKPADDGYVADGDFYCDCDCLHEAGYEFCERCGEIVGEMDAIVFECDGDFHLFCCDTCASYAGFERCERCGEWTDATSCVHRRGYEETWCDSCAYDHSAICAGCGDSYDLDEMQQADWEWYCEDCYHGDSSSEHLHNYGWTPKITFHGLGGLNTPFMGVELETDGGRDRGDYCEELHDIDGFPRYFWMTEDGSLENGVEITSQPMTLGFHEVIRDIYDQISDVAESHGYVSHNGGRCGLHVHVSRGFFGKSEVVQDAGGYKMMRLLQRFEQQFTIFSRRSDNHWCSYRTCEDYTPKPETQPSVRPKAVAVEPPMLYKAAKMKREQAHSQALNFEHRQTFEFRIFRGTLKWSTYFACLGLVNGICHTVKHHGSIWVESVSWYDLIDEIVERCDEDYSRECLADYLDEKGLR